MGKKYQTQFWIYQHFFGYIEKKYQKQLWIYRHFFGYIDKKYQKQFWIYRKKCCLKICFWIYPNKFVDI
jgi:hypothetical protein